MRLVTGIRALDVLPNGTDTDHYHPFEVPQVPQSAVFWGRLDFGPNIQALEWFCHRVWPLVRSRIPDGRFTIIGFNPSREATSGAPVSVTQSSKPLADPNFSPDGQWIVFNPSNASESVPG